MKILWHREDKEFFSGWRAQPKNNKGRACAIDEVRTAKDTPVSMLIVFFLKLLTILIFGYLIYLHVKGNPPHDLHSN